MPRPAFPESLAIDPLSGEFADSRTESAYLAGHLPRTRAQLAFTLLRCGLYFLGFLATDRAALGPVPHTAALLGAQVLAQVSRADTGTSTPCYSSNACCAERMPWR